MTERDATKPRLLSGGKRGDVRRNANPLRLRNFRSVVWEYWKEHGRHDLPWRQTTDPYKILVSEVMLQQTQVPRVIEKYTSFLARFPTLRALADATLADVLKEWNGLGYNRRGKYLHDAAKVIATAFNGDAREALDHQLPGVGPYTRSAVRVFAFNEPDILIETNIRTVFIHHFFAATNSPIGEITGAKILDKELEPIIRKAAEGQEAREWHWALMDYGAYLKKSGVRNNHRSKHYTKQSKFDGSLRQVRGEILRALSNGTSLQYIQKANAERFEHALEGLAKDTLIKKEKGKWRIA